MFSQINGGINDRCRSECRRIHVCEKDYAWNPATCNCENGKYLVSIKNDSEITCDEVIESNKEETNFNKKKAICKISILYLPFY